MLTDDLVVFLNESYVVTRSCFDLTTVIFDAVTPEWKDFCREALGFQVPDWTAESARVRETLRAQGII